MPTSIIPTETVVAFEKGVVAREPLCTHRYIYTCLFQSLSTCMIGTQL